MLPVSRPVWAGDSCGQHLAGVLIPPFLYLRGLGGDIHTSHPERSIVAKVSDPPPSPLLAPPHGRRPVAYLMGEIRKRLTPKGLFDQWWGHCIEEGRPRKPASGVSS